MNIKKIKIFVLFLVVLSLVYNSDLSKLNATEIDTMNLISLTTTVQETDYYIQIGATKYTINTIDTLADATFALLEWESKGSLDSDKIVSNFNNVNYEGFENVYTVLYDLLLKSATQTFTSGSNLVTGNNIMLSGTNIWKISGTVSTAKEYITCPQNTKLIIIADEGATLKYDNAASRINVGRETETGAGEVAFIGRSAENKITITGLGTNTAHTKSPLILKNGSLYLNNVSIKNFYFTATTNSTIMIPSGHDAARFMYMSNSSMDSLYGKYSPAIFCKAFYSDGSNVKNANSRLYLYNNTFSNCRIKNNNTDGNNMTETNGGAVIRSYAADNCDLRVEKCMFKNNKAGTGTVQQQVKGAGGGAIYWKSLGNRASLIDCTFIGNSTTCVGGAVYSTGKMEIEGCTFDGNSANYGGGAIAVEPVVTNDYYASVDTTNLKGTLTLDENTVITNNNTGVYGGGVFFNAIKSQIQSPITNYEMELIINGATFTANTSNSYGGAVAMYLNYADYSYKTGITINEGSLFETNNASNNGGAIWMGSSESCECNLNEGVIMNGGNIDKNNAKNGGGVCIESGKEEVSMNFLMNNGNVKNNIAINDGGAIYLTGGNFNIKGGIIGEIDNGKKYGNKAERGGAIYVTGGNFTMNGGTIEGNTATSSGGGIQISDGNVYITDGKILSNVARGETSETGYGGGIFVDGGEEVRITGGEISNNVAAKNGGGIEVQTDNTVVVDVYSGKFTDNVADGCGGAVGIECDNGTINVGDEMCDGTDERGHEHPIISDNIAGMQGGGFYINGLNAVLNIYCSSIDANNVKNVENNFEQLNGTSNIFDGVQVGESNEGIIIVGGTFVDKREFSDDVVVITYYSNFEGSLEFKQASITKGTLITIPGNIFGVQGYKVIGWTEDQSNETLIEYETGTVIELVEDITMYALWVPEEANEASFIVIIPDELFFNNNGEMMTFSLEVTLNLFPRNKALNINLVDEDFELKLYEDGEIIDSASYVLCVDEREIHTNGTVLSVYSDSALITYKTSETVEVILVDRPKYVGEYQDTLTFTVSVGD